MTVATLTTKNVLQSLNPKDRVTRSTQTKDPGGPPPINRTRAASDRPRGGQREVTVQGLRCRSQHAHTVLAPSSGRTKATRTSLASQPPRLPWQTPDSTASTVRPPHGQFEHAGILFVPDTLAAILSLRRPLVSRRTPSKCPVGKTWKLKST